MALFGDSLLALKSVTALSRPGGVDVPGSWSWEFEQSKGYHDHDFDNSGFENLADVTDAPNQVSHFIGIAYIVLPEFENPSFLGIGDTRAITTDMIDRIDSGDSAQAVVDRQLGYIAQEFDYNLYDGMDLFYAFRRAVQAIQAYGN